MRRNKIQIGAMTTIARSVSGILAIAAALAILLLCASAVSAQSFSIMPYAKIQFFDSNGRPLVGGKVCSYQAGTTTPLATYSDSLGTLNTNPVTLDASGRANIWLGTSAYKIQLQDSTGTPGVCNGNVIWTVDNIIVNLAALLSLSNTWTAPQTFNAATTFNALATFNSGITSSGPNTLAGGGTLSGTFGGAPTFSGTPNFSSGFTSTTGSFSGQITSTVSTGTPPFVIASTTNVPNLNASLLLGCTWAAPCAIGGTTPASAIFTTLQANTSFVLNGSSAMTATSGNGTKMATAGTITGGAGTTVCDDGAGNITTTGCAAGRVISLGTNSSVCSTTNSAGSTCTTNVTITPTQADTLYIASCSGVTITGAPYIAGLQKTTTQITVTISNGQGSQAIISTYGELDCSAIHP